MKRALVLIVLLGAVAATALAQDAGWIGTQVEDRKEGGVLIRQVEANSPAARAGLKEHDVITEFNKQSVAGVLQLTRMIQETPVGRTVELRVQRDNRQQNLQVTTEKAQFPGVIRFNQGNAAIRVRPPDLSALNDLRDRLVFNVPKVQVLTLFSRGGLQVESLTPQLREFFGVKGGDGVLITSVDSGSAADKAGLTAGDVITSIDGRGISAPQEFGRPIQVAGSTTLKIIRDKQEREIKIEGGLR